MDIIVNSTNFRSNYAMFINQLISQGGVIKIRKGRNIVAKLIPETNTKKNNNWNKFWKDMDDIWSKQKVSKQKTNYSMKVDEILYGA